MSIKSVLKKDNLVNAAIWYTIGTFVLKGINFFTMKLYANILSTEDVGIFGMYSMWTAIFAVVMGVAINATVGSAHANLDSKEYKKYLSSSLFLGTLSFIVIAIVMLIFRYPIARLLRIPENLMVGLILESFFSFVISFVTSVYTFDKNYFGYLTASFLVTILNIGISVIWIISVSSDKYIARVYGGVIATVLVGIVLYVKTIKRGKTLVDVKLWKFCLPIAIPLVFHNLSHLILNQADKVMLKNTFDSDSMIGIYTYIYTIGALLNIVQQALNSAWLPWYYEGLKKDDKEDIKKKSAYYMIIFTALTVMFILGGKEVILMFLSKEYSSGVEFLPLIIVGYYFVYLYTFCANYQFYKKQTKFVAIGTGISALVNIGVNAVLIPRQGMYGAALATLIANATLFVMHYLIVKFKFKHEDFPVTYYIIGISTVFIFMIINKILIDYFIIRWAIIFAILLICCYGAFRVYKEVKLKNNNINDVLE